MRTITILAIIAILAGASTLGTTAFSSAAAQMTDNATMGNMTGGNMTGGNMTNDTGSVSARPR